MNNLLDDILLSALDKKIENLEKKVTRKYKVYVYAIAKNEAKFVNKWVDSMQEADGIYVMLDATTTDNTEELLRARGVHVEKKLIRPWRFDTARNESLNMVPEDADVCVCTDLDEVFSPGWRDIIEENWKDGCCRGEYDFWLNASQKNEAPDVIKNYKIHSRKDFYWKWIVHEFVIPYDWGKMDTIPMPGMLLCHYPDITKKRNYIEMLKRAIETEPKERRYYEYLVAESSGNFEWDTLEWAVNALEKKFLYDSKYDYCFLMKAKCEVYSHKKDFESVEKLCLEVINKYNDARWFYGELAYIYVVELGKHQEGIELFKKCLQIKNPILGHYDMKWFDNESIYNYISIGYYWLKDYKQAVNWINKAIAGKPLIKEYQNNLELYNRMIEGVGN